MTKPDGQEAQVIRLMCDILRNSDQQIVERTQGAINYSALNGVDIVRQKFLSSIIAAYPDLDKRRLDRFTRSSTL